MLLEPHYEQRSAVLAVSSRISGDKRKTHLAHAGKDRLLCMAKWRPFNSVLDPGEYKSGSSVAGLSHEVNDPWQPDQEMVLPDELEAIQKTKVKVRLH